MRAQGIAARLRQASAPVRQRCLEHPFVLGIGDGTLSTERFVRWIVQDWLYLQAYLEVVEAAAQLAPGREATTRWKEMARLTRDVELDLHRAMAARHDVAPEALDRATPLPATARYTQALGRGATAYPTLVATLVPCAVGYAEIGQRLAAGSVHERYGEWVAMYADEAFAAAAQWLEGELDGCEARGAGVAEVEAAYGEAAQCELGLWDALWKG